MSARNEFLVKETARLLQPGESVLNTGTVFTGPLFLSSLFGMLGQLLMLTHYFAILTNRRLVLIQTGMGFTGVKADNRGVIEFPISELNQVTVGGMMNQKSLTLRRKDGTSTVIRFNSMVRQVEGQKAFCSEVAPKLQQLIGA
jgi:hypothetical protein